MHRYGNVSGGHGALSKPDPAACQRASAKWRNLLFRALSNRSMRSMGWPVSMAVELATARAMAAREGLSGLRFGAGRRGAFIASQYTPICDQGLGVAVGSAWMRRDGGNGRTGSDGADRQTRV